MNLKVLALSLVIASVSHQALAVNNAPADAAVVNLRTSCTENGGSTEIPDCFDSMGAVNSWLVNVRNSGPTKPTLVNIGPGTFGNWSCSSGYVTLRGSGRDRTILSSGSNILSSAIEIAAGCTNLSVQDLTVDGHLTTWGVLVLNINAVTRWTNVEVLGGVYGWVETIKGCSSPVGEHLWFSSRIISVGLNGAPASRAYTATCATSWFWGSELTSNVNWNEANGFALEAHGAEIHFYGSNARLLLAANTQASVFNPAAGGGGHYLFAALAGSEVHIHGTGLDVVHKGSGTADMLYADSSSHFHANESGFNIHVTGAGKVQRLDGAGRIETPYTWGPGIQPPLSAASNGVQTLIARNGTDTYIETDCPISGNCSAGGTYPHLMIYRAECTGTGPAQGPWFDTVTKACRQ